MKYLLFLILLGCSQKGINTTLILKEDEHRLHNLKNETCLISGYQVILDKNSDSKQYLLITFYSNCDVRQERKLKEAEQKYWLLKPVIGQIK